MVLSSALPVMKTGSSRKINSSDEKHHEVEFSLCHVVQSVLCLRVESIVHRPGPCP